MEQKKDTQLPAEQNKWEAKEWGEESYAITNGKTTIVTSDACDDGYLLAIVDLLNGSGYRFHSENKLELDLHIEAETAKMELAQWKDHCKALQAKCDGHEAALKDIMNRSRPQDMIYIIANEALSAEEGEKENQENKIVIHNNSDAFRNWVTDVKGYSISLLGHSTGIHLPDGVTQEVFESEWLAYEKANNPANQKEDKQ